MGFTTAACAKSMGYLVSYIVRLAAFEAAGTGHAAAAAAASARARACSGVLRVGAAASGNTLIQTVVDHRLENPLHKTF